MANDKSENAEVKRGRGRLPKASAQIKWISSGNPRHPYVTIDSRERLYIPTSTRELLNLPENSRFRLNVGYDLINNRIILAKPEVVRITDVKPFNFDDRSYAKAKIFVSQAGLSGKLPVRFKYVGQDFSEYPAGSYAFQLEETEAPDDKGRKK